MSRKPRTLWCPDRTRHQTLRGLFFAIKLLAPWCSLTSVHPHSSDSLVLSLTVWHFQTGIAAENQRLTAIRKSCLYLTPENDIPRIFFCQNTLKIATSRSLTRTSPQNNACHVPKNGQARRRPVEPPRSKIRVCLDFVFITLRQKGAGSWLFLREKLLKYEVY